MDTCFSVVETALYVVESLLVAQVVDLTVIMIMCDMRSALSTMKCKTEHVNWYTEKTGHRLVMVNTNFKCLVCLKLQAVYLFMKLEKRISSFKTFSTCL